MRDRDPKLTAQLFNQRIAERDPDGLAALMTFDHRLVVHGHVDAATKVRASEVWKEFFGMFPDYVNIISRIDSRDNMVLMIGRSACSNEPALNGPAIWTARIECGLVAEWRVHKDTPFVRESLGIYPD